MSNCRYSLVAPDGGWGYVVVISLAVNNICTFMPLVTFGIFFGDFLKTIGDEAGGTALAVGVYLSVQWSTGLLANILLQKLTYRIVGVIGAFLNFIGLLGASFAFNLFQFVFTFSVIQGVGYGLMLPAMLTAFNLYFDKRRAVAYNFVNIVLILASVPLPAFASFLMTSYGFRGANAIQACISLNCVPLMLCLHPIEWHLKKRKLSLSEIKSRELVELNKLNSKKEEIIEQGVKLLSADERNNSSYITEYQNEVLESSVCLSAWKSVATFLDLQLFTDPIYINISIGVSLCLSADFTFLSILPLLLTNFNVNSNDTTLILTIFYAADIVGRIGLFGLAACTEITNRNLMLIGAIFVICIRTAFMMGNTFWWLAICSALMGSLRCLFHTTYPLIFAELYTKRFVTAFSLFMVVCGVVSLLIGLLIGVVKDATGSDEVVVHFLTILNAVCAIPWLLEYFYVRITKRHSSRSHETGKQPNNEN